VLVSPNEQFKTSQNYVLFSRLLSEYPSKSIYYQTAHRVLSYFEKDIKSYTLIMNSMDEEGEDKEIVQNIKFFHDNPTIKTQSELTTLCVLLSDYVKYSKLLKNKNSFIKSLDVLDDDEAPIREVVDTMYHISSKMVEAYNVANITAVSHRFDSDDIEGMRTVVAETKDSRSADRCLITSFKGLNTMLAPGYLSGCLYVYAGLPGNYKSGILLQGHVDTCLYNEHIKNTTHGKQPVSIYITMENSMAQTVRRLWSLLYPQSDMDSYSVDEIVEMINARLNSTGVRSVLLYYGYREKSTADIANIIRSFNTETTEVVALWFDYLKRVRPASTDEVVRSSEKGELNAIMNEFKTMAIQFNIPIVTGHQLNRVAAQAVDQVAAHGGYNKSAEILGRSHIGSAFEVLEVADDLFILNIENNGDRKDLMLKAAKRRDVDASVEGSDITAIRHPFYSTDSFALQPDIMESVTLSQPIFFGKQLQNFVANI
jgi:hypothetical protein